RVSLLFSPSASPALLPRVSTPSASSSTSGVPVTRPVPWTVITRGSLELFGSVTVCAVATPAADATVASATSAPAATRVCQLHIVPPTVSDVGVRRWRTRRGSRVVERQDALLDPRGGGERRNMRVRGRRVGRDRPRPRR